jgi:hypothetical protein
MPIIDDLINGNIIIEIGYQGIPGGSGVASFAQLQDVAVAGMADNDLFGWDEASGKFIPKINAADVVQVSSDLTVTGTWAFDNLITGLITQAQALAAAVVITFGGALSGEVSFSAGGDFDAVVALEDGVVTNTKLAAAPINYFKVGFGSGVTDVSPADARTILNVADGAQPGTVTSVGLSAPNIFSVSGSPVTTTGTLTMALANQAINVVFAGPGSGGNAAPTFRALVANDIPTLTAAKISDFSATVHLSRLDQMAAPNTNLSLNSHRLINVSDPVDPQDATTKAYVDALKQGLTPKDSVIAASTGNLVLSGTQTIDGVNVVAGDRVLVKDQSDPIQNGIYVVVNGGAWTRAIDMNAAADVVSGAYVFVEQGTVNDNSGWVLTTNEPVIGTSSLDFVQFSGAGQITAGAGMTKSGNTLNVVGTSNRIVINADSIDIADTYAGQNTINTVGTITTGVWNGTVIALTHGGTGSDLSGLSTGALIKKSGSGMVAAVAGTDYLSPTAGTAGDLWYRGASGFELLPKGTVDQILRQGATYPYWDDESEGGISDPTLTAMAGVTTAADKLIYFTDVDTAAATDFTSFGRSVAALADAAAGRTLFGLGTAATYDRGSANGVASLDAGGKVPTSQLPALAITDTFVVANQAAMLALTAETGDVAVRTDLNKSFILAGDDPATLADWQELLTPTDAVTSVNGATGVVSLTYTDVGAAAASHSHAISDVTGLQTALDGKQAIVNPVTALASVTGANDKLFYFTGAATGAVTDFTSFGRSTVALADAAAGRTLFGAAAASHSHAISDVTGLQAALDAKQAIVNPVTALAGVTGANNKMFYFTGVATGAVTDLTSFGRDVMALADAAAGRTLFGAAASSHSHAISDTTGLQTALDAKQAIVNPVTALAGVTGANDKLFYFTGAATGAVADFTSFGRSTVALADAAAGRTLFGLGTSATYDRAAANGVASLDASTKVPVAQIPDIAISGVTGLQTALDGKQAVVNPVTALASVTGANDKLFYFTGAATGAVADFTSFGRSTVALADAAAGRTLFGLGTAATYDRGSANGVASLDAGGKVPTSQLPALAITDTFVVASQAAMLALTAETGDVAVRTDLNKTFILAGDDPTTLGDWQEVLAPTAAVSSVNGYTGAVDLTYTDVDAAAASHSHAISDVTGLQAALDAKQAIVNPVTALAGVTGANNKLFYFTGTNTGAVTDFTSFGRSVAALADAAAGRTLFGLGTSDNPEFATINLGAASDTTLARIAAGRVSIEGAEIATLTGTQVFSNKSFTDSVTLSSTDTGAGGGPFLLFDRNSSSPAAQDYIGEIDFLGRSSTGVSRTYTWFAGQILTTTNTSEKGQLAFGGLNAGADGTWGWMNSDGLFMYKQDDTGSNVGPDLGTYRYSANPAANDLLGRVVFAGHSSTGVYREFGYIQGKSPIVTNAAEDGEIQFFSLLSGSQTFLGLVGAYGWVVGEPSEYGKGHGTINIQNELYIANKPQSERVLVVAVSDELTTITTGTAKVTFRAPFAMTLTKIPKATLTTVSSSGNPTFDINEGGTSVLGANKLSIDSGEKTSTTAATATTLADTAIADDAEITIDIDTAGTGAKGAKIYIYYKKA